MSSAADNDKIAPALNRFQSTVETISVSSQTFWDVCREPLYECGLSLTQSIKLKGGIAYITTSLEHDSGQLIEHRTPVKPIHGQQFGPWVEMLAFQNLIGILGFVSPNTNEGTVFSLVIDNDTPTR